MQWRKQEWNEDQTGQLERPAGQGRHQTDGQQIFRATALSPTILRVLRAFAVKKYGTAKARRTRRECNGESKSGMKTKLVNWNVPLVKDGIKRMVNKL
jgi:hypothetical protein